MVVKAFTAKYLWTQISFMILKKSVISFAVRENFIIKYFTEKKNTSNLLKFADESGPCIPIRLSIVYYDHCNITLVHS